MGAAHGVGLHIRPVQVEVFFMCMDIGLGEVSAGTAMAGTMRLPAIPLASCANLLSLPFVHCPNKLENTTPSPQRPAPLQFPVPRHLVDDVDPERQQRLLRQGGLAATGSDRPLLREVLQTAGSALSPGTAHGTAAALRRVLQAAGSAFGDAQCTAASCDLRGLLRRRRCLHDLLLVKRHLPIRLHAAGRAQGVAGP